MMTVIVADNPSHKISDPKIVHKGSPVTPRLLQTDDDGGRMSSTRTHSPCDPLGGELSDTLSCDGDIETEHTGAGPDIADIDISRLALPVRGYLL